MKRTPTGPPPSLQTLGEIGANIRRLAEFYRAHKPNVTHIRIFADDFAKIAQWPKKAERCGFQFHGKQIRYMGFELRSDAENV